MGAEAESVRGRASHSGRVGRNGNVFGAARVLWHGSRRLWLATVPRQPAFRPTTLRGIREGQPPLPDLDATETSRPSTTDGYSPYELGRTYLDAECFTVPHHRGRRNRVSTT
jgi:hypothetical protein